MFKCSSAPLLLLFTLRYLMHLSMCQSQWFSQGFGEFQNQIYRADNTALDSM